MQEDVLGRLLVLGRGGSGPCGPRLPHKPAILDAVALASPLPNKELWWRNLRKES